jgi:lipoprotein|nr:MAG TPA: protein of unknown function (DUF4969) [Caudoviricetes sp.]
MLKKLFLFLVLIFFIGCGSEKTTDTPQEPIKEDNSSMSVVITDKKTGDTWIQILVPDDATDIQIGEKMADYVKKYLDDGMKDFIVQAYGDQRFWNKTSGTHGYTIVRNGQNIESYSQARAYIPSEDEKELYLEYYHAVTNLIDTGEKEETAKQIVLNILTNRLSKSEQEIKDILAKVDDYLDLKSANVKAQDTSKDTNEVSYADFKKVKGFEDYIAEKGKDINDESIKSYLKEEKIDLSVEEFKALQEKVTEWDKNRNK